MKKESVMVGFTWKLAERFGVQGIQFILQIVLARILDPAHYGTLSLMIIFVNLANSFIHHGMNMSLVQRKDVTENDYSYVFWALLGGTSIIYLSLFLFAPWIEIVFKTEDFTYPFRVLMLMLFPGVMNSVNVARFSRSMNFKKMFFGTVVGTVISGTVSIILATHGAGLWALVAQTLLKETLSCLIMWILSNWMPRWVMNGQRIRLLFRYGWKLMLSSLINTLYGDLRSMVIGIKYSSADLGYYNRGKQFPDFVIHSVNGAVQSVMLPAMSEYQDKKEELRRVMRMSISLSAYVIFPIMAGLAAVAEPMVKVLLTDKWLPCVPFLRVYCFILAFHPVHSCNLQAINAIGRSDIYLKLEIIKKVYGLIALASAVIFFNTPLAIALTGAFTTIVSCFVNASPNKKLIGYSYFAQMKDILPSLLMSVAMGAIVLLIGQLKINCILLLVIQIIVGIFVYVLMSSFFKLEPYKMFLSVVQRFLKKEKNKDHLVGRK